MRFDKLRLAAVAGGVSLLAALAAPAQAYASQTWTDADGNDYHPFTFGPVTTSDGTSESTDIKSARFETVNIGGVDMMRATFTIDGFVPQQGAGLPTDMDLDGPAFVGGSYKLMFNNEDKQTNADNPMTGCTKVGGGRARDQQGHWADGYYKFIGVSVTYDGLGWSHTPEVGTYDPSPQGGFVYNDIESDSAMFGLYVPPTVTYTSGATYTPGADSIVQVAVSGVVRFTDSLCVSGYYEEDFASENLPGPYTGTAYTGDRISNLAAISTADLTVVLPVAIPLSLVPGESDVKAIGGWVTVSDTTNRASGGPVYTPGPMGDLAFLDTLGNGPTCPTPTVGGTLPDNPLWAANQNQPCMIDDDIAGNAVLTEFRKSGINLPIVSY